MPEWVSPASIVGFVCSGILAICLTPWREFILRRSRKRTESEIEKKNLYEEVCEFLYRFPREDAISASELKEARILGDKILRYCDSYCENRFSNLIDFLSLHPNVPVWIIKSFLLELKFFLIESWPNE
jgi:hypothetical protein